MKRYSRGGAAFAVLLLGGAMAGCDSDVETTPIDNGNNEPTQTTVEVNEYEFHIALDRTSAPTGKVRFEVTNTGTEIHEFLVIKTDLAPDALPTEDNGSYLEDGPGTDLIDEIEQVMPGDSAVLTLDLSGGNYVLICNMVETEDNGEEESHYAEGMHTAFKVIDTPSQ